MTVVLTVPQTNLPAGPGVFTSAAIPAAGTQLRVNFVQVGWPLAGDLALSYWLDMSSDGGNTWRTLSAGDVWDVAASVGFGCGLPDVGNSNRQIRMRYVFAKALVASGSLQVI